MSTDIAHASREAHKVLIATPWQKQVSPITAFCVSQLVSRNNTAAVLHYGDAFVAHSRNTCGDVFLQSPLEWMLMVDDDMIVPFGDATWFKTFTEFDDFPEQFLAMNAIDRLMSHGKTLVGALYFGRNRKANPMYNEGCEKSEGAYARKAPYDLVKVTRWVGTGCILIHRRVLEDIEKRFPALARDGKGRGGQWFTSTEASIMDSLTKTRDMLSASGGLTSENAYRALVDLERIVRHGRLENPLGSGEDVSFCLRAAAAGHPAYVDMGLICGHVGYQVFGPRNTGQSE